MADYGSEVAAEYEVSREAQDAWAYQSQRRYADALGAGRLTDEIVAMPIPQRKGDAVDVVADEQPRPDTTLDGWRRSGRRTQAAASPRQRPGVNDGASAVLMMRGHRARAWAAAAWNLASPGRGRRAGEVPCDRTRSRPPGRTAQGRHERW